MPPELHLTHRASRGEVIACLLTTVLFVAVCAVVHWAYAENPAYHDAPILKKILMLTLLDGCLLFFVLCCIYGIIYIYHHRLIFDENGITEHGIRSVKTIRFPEITAIQWDLNYSRVKLRTMTTQITIRFEIFRRDKERIKAFIVFLRESVPFDRQKDWKKFCQRMEQYYSWWDKNTIPVPEPEKGEILYTRKMFNRTIPWMIIGSVITMFGFAYPVYLMLMQGKTLDDIPEGYTGRIIIFLGTIWMGWAVIRYSISKNGKILLKKHLLLEYYTYIVFGLVAFSFPYAVFFMCHSPFWGQIIYYSLFTILFLPAFWMAYQKRKDIKQSTESLPDDYMPKIFEKKE